MVNGKIDLPRTTEEGKPRISYSQYNLWNEIKSFNLGILGRKEYIIKYFLDYGFEDVGFGIFGKDVEAYIMNRERSNKFNDKEKETLNRIKPIGKSEEFTIDLGEFDLYGIKDDRVEGMIRDYKTGSESSIMQYKKDSYKQLDIYALDEFVKTGNIPEIEVCGIERIGNPYRGGGRNALKVGEKIWYIKREVNEQQLMELKKDIIRTVQEISNHYKIFNLVNNIKTK